MCELCKDAVIMGKIQLRKKKEQTKTNMCIHKKETSVEERQGYRYESTHIPVGIESHFAPKRAIVGFFFCFVVCFILVFR